MARTEMGLTIKQQRVCDLVAKGLTTKEIAQQLGIGVRTVEGHRDVIYQKLGVRNAVQLVRKMLGASQ
jgi:DNA-binding NarL/FixJ family response regulator